MGNNITAAEYTTGNLESIDFLAGIIGNVVVVIISIVGFGIVMSAIAKNAFAGLYATNSKFWDRVDEAHKAGSGISIKGSNIFQVIGSVGTFALSKFPNIKAMTEFEDEVLDAKAYFMKALPLACVQILIGVFIFRGYPTEVANKATEFGTGMFDLILTNVDPVAWVEALPDKLAILSFSTDGANDDFSIYVNKVAKSVSKTYIGYLDDMTKEKRISMARALEGWIIENMNADAYTYCNSDKYKMSVSATMTSTTPDLERVHNKVVNNIATFSYAIPVDTYEHGSTKDTANMFIRYDLIFTPVASKGNMSAIDNNLVVPTSGWSANTNGNYLTIVMSNDVASGYSIAGLSNISATVLVDGSDVNVKLTVSGNTITVKPTSSSNKITSATAINNISGLYYIYDEGKHPVRSLTTGSVSVPTFSPVDKESGITEWTWGSSPTATSDESTNTTAPTGGTTTPDAGTTTPTGGW